MDSHTFVARSRSKGRVLLMIGLLVGSSALQAQERRPTRGERLALEGRCAAAMPELEQELRQVPAPESGRVSWRLGQCALRSGDYARAASALEQALQLDPSLTEVNLDLARARYHAGDVDGADAALRAGESLSGEALWQLYRGMVDLQRGDAQAAVVALQRAVDLNAEQFRTRSDPQAVEPVASYYLAIALRAAGKEDEANQRLREVADSWAGTDWASEANRALGRALGRRAWLALSAGIEYDSNVLLAGRDTPLPQDISNQDGMRGVWLARGGADLGSWQQISANLVGSYRGRAHFDGDLSTDFDSHFPTASLVFTRPLRADTHARLRYDFGYAWVDTDPFLVSNGGRLSLIHAWSARSTTELYGRAYVDDYLYSVEDTPDGPGVAGGLCQPPALPAPYTFCGPRGLNERSARDRDGYGGGVGLAHAMSVPLGLGVIPDPALRGDYSFTSFEGDGREYTHDAHRFSLGLGFALPWSLGLDVEGSYTHRDFRHASTFPDQDDLIAAADSNVELARQYFLSDSPRREDAFGADVRLSIPLLEPFSASITYSYRDNVSNSDLFDYDQHIVGLLLNATFARAL
jgi:tetratricopeptide (TPR) repeat protein